MTDDAPLTGGDAWLGVIVVSASAVGGYSAPTRVICVTSATARSLPAERRGKPRAKPAGWPNPRTTTTFPRTRDWTLRRRLLRRSDARRACSAICPCAQEHGAFDDSVSGGSPVAGRIAKSDARLAPAGAGYAVRTRPRPRKRMNEIAVLSILIFERGAFPLRCGATAMLTLRTVACP